MEASVGFFDINFVAQDSLLGMVPAKVVDEMQESEHCVAKNDAWELLRSDPLVDWFFFLSVERQVLGDSLLRNYVSAFVDGELVLVAHWVDLGLFDPS